LATTTPDGEPPLSPPGAVPAGSLGIDLAVAAGNRVIPADGAPFTVLLPPRHQINDLVRVRDGWIVQSYLDSQGDDAGFYLWFVRRAGESVPLGRNYGNFAVSADGRRLVVASGDDALVVTAYELHSLRSIAQVRVEGPGPLVYGIVGDQVVLRDAAGDPSPTRAYVWNLRTGQLRPTDAAVNIWGVSDDGPVLRRFYPAGGRGCVDLVAIVDLPTVRDTGLWSEAIGAVVPSASLSPDGSWALISVDPTVAPVWVRTADLRAGRWRPTSVGLRWPASALFWDTDTSVIVRGDESEYYRCRPTQPCQRLAVPAYQDGVILAERRG
jgi:hypothetical protein